MSTELIEEAFYVSNVKIPKDSDGNMLEYPARFEVKLDRQKSGDEFTGKFVSNKKFNHEVLIYDENKNLIPMDETNYDTVIPKGSQCITIVELVYISITAKVSCKWKLVQAKVFKNQKAITDYAIVDDDEEENEVSTSELKDDLDSEPCESNQEVTEEAVDDLVDDLQDVSLTSENIDKPTKRGRKRN